MATAPAFTTWGNPWSSGDVAFNGSRQGTLEANASSETWNIGLRPGNLTVYYTCAASTNPLTLRVQVYAPDGSTVFSDLTAPMVQDGAQHGVFVNLSGLGGDLYMVYLTVTDSVTHSGVNSLTTLKSIVVGGVLLPVFWTNRVRCSESDS